MQSDKNILQEKLQKLYGITMEVNELMPPEEKHVHVEVSIDGTWHGQM